MEWEPLCAQLVALDRQVLTPDESAEASQMLRADMFARLKQANQREADATNQIRQRQDWQRYRDERLDALRRSMGSPPDTPLAVEVTATIPGEGFVIENLVIAGRPGLPITANLYRPEPPRPRMPGIVICTSHHNPKHQAELQDMGMTWARSGAMVIVPDQLGHGERRQQPFAGREDYHWRYNLGVQLHLVGQSLIAWMVADVRRCIDVLLARPGIDPERIIMIGSVAGGGEPAAIATALDPRVTCSIPFNFGSGHQTELPGEPSPFYRWDGFGDWESTRCLRLSARDGFFPWMIVAAAAPRPLVFGKEFAFDAAKDPAFQRIRGIYEMYGATDRVAEVHGWGNVTLRPPAASHCNNIGPAHRERFYPLLERWLDMPIPQEYRNRLQPESLNCMTPQAAAKFSVRKVHQVAADLANQQIAEARQRYSGLAPAKRRQALRDAWTPLLGDIEPAAELRVVRSSTTQPAGARIERVLLEVEPRIHVPLLLLQPAGTPEPTARRPVVIAFCQHGKGSFLARHTAEIADLLARGTAVCLPDLRGTGETSPGPEREYNASITEISAQELKLGRTLLGSRLRDLRSVIRYLATREEIDADRLALWGDSLALTNPERLVDPPLRTQYPPAAAEPMGAMLAILGALYEDNVKAVLARGGLTGYAAVLEAPAFYVPHDAVVPGCLAAGDVGDLAAALAPIPLRIEACVDGRNRAASASAIDTAFASARPAYADSPKNLVLSTSASEPPAQWLARCLQLTPQDTAALGSARAAGPGPSWPSK